MTKEYYFTLTLGFLIIGMGIFFWNSSIEKRYGNSLKTRLVRRFDEITDDPEVVLNQ